MISGQVNKRREPVIRLDVRGHTGRRRRLTAIVDTGYNGTLTLPLGLVKQLQLKWDRVGSGTLADGSKVGFDVYLAKVHWDGSWRSVVVAACGDEVLAGMELLDGYELHVEAKVGGSITIKPMR